MTAQGQAPSTKDRLDAMNEKPTPAPMPDRPPGVPEDYQPILLRPQNGQPPILVWGRVVETRSPTGQMEVTIEGMIPGS